MSTSKMTRRVTRSSVPSVRSLSADEEDDDISIHSIVRPRSAIYGNNSNYSSTRLQREEVTHQYLSASHVNHFEMHGDTNNHFTRYSGNSDGDSHNSFTESAYIDRSTIQNSIFHRFHWCLWSFIYLRIINVMNFDVWLLSRLHSFGKIKVVIILCLPLLLYLLAMSGLLQSDSSLTEDNSQKFSSIISPIYNFLSSIFSPIFGFFKKNEDQNDADTATCDSNVIYTFFHSIGGLFGTVSGWLIRTGEKASLLVENNHPVQYDEQEEEIKSIWNEEKIYAQSSREEMNMLASEVERFKENDKNVQKEIKSLHLEFKSLTGVVEKLEKELKKQSEKNEMKENLAAISSEYKSHIGQLNIKLKAIEAKMNVLESRKSCCDKQWNEADILALLEKHLILAFKNVVDAHSDATSKYKFFNEWLNSKFYNHEKLMQEINIALNKHKSSYTDKTMSYDNVMKVVESSVLRHVQSVKRNLSESTQFAYSSFNADMLSEDKVKKIVKEAIMLYDADKIGQVDYALESGGGSVFGTRCSETYIEKYGKWSIFGLPLWTNSNSPRTAIQPDVQPGRCWAFKGSQGFLVIELSATIYPTGFTLEHIPVSLSPTGSIDSAPKNFSVWGLDNEKDNRGIILGEYSYDITGEPLQYFPIKKHSEKAYAYVELQIHSNHGNLEYTCLYRFRVHGKRVAT